MPAVVQLAVDRSSDAYASGLWVGRTFFFMGKKQAVAALGLGGIAVLLFAFAVTKGIREHGAGRLALREGAPSAAGQSEELNYRFDGPPRPYVEIDAQAINEDAAFGFMRNNPQVMFVCIAERTGLDFDLDTVALAEISRGNLESVARTADFSAQRPFEVHGLRGVRFDSDVQAMGRDFAYVHWVCATNGFAYQLIAWSKAKHARALHRDVEGLLDGFHLLDPERVAYSESSGPLPPMEEPLLGYQSALTGPDWLVWGRLREDFPTAEHGGMLGAEGGFLLHVMLHPGRRPRLEGAAQALLAAEALDYPGPAFKDVGPAPRIGLQGLRMDSSQTEGSTKFFNRHLVLSGSNATYLITAYTQDPGRLDAIAEKAFAGIVTDESTIPADVLTRLDERRLAAQAAHRNRLGLYRYHQDDFRGGLEHFKAAVGISNSNAAYVRNVMDVLSRLGSHEEAVAYYQAHAAPHREDDELTSWYAWHLRHGGKPEEARGVYAALFASGYRNEEDILSYGVLLQEAEEWERLDEVYGAYLEGGDSRAVHIDQARSYIARGEVDRGVDALEAIHAGEPLDTDAAFALIQACLNADRPSEAIPVCDGLISNKVALADACYWKGLAQAELKWYRRAKATLERGLAESPDDPALQELIRQVSGMLGEGSNTSLKESIEPVALPAPIRDMLPGNDARPERLDTLHHAYFGYRVIGYEFRPAEELKYTLRRRITVLDAAGVSSFSTLEVSFDSLHEQLFVNRLEVLDPSGRVAARGDVSTYYVLDDTSSGMATYDQTAQLPVPGLQPGYTIELTATVRQKSPPDSFLFDEVLMSAGLPVILAAAHYAGPAEKIRTREIRLDPPREEDGVLIWQVRNPLPYAWEPEPASYRAFLPSLVLSAARAGWEEEGQSYLERIEDVLRPDAAVQKTAQELTEGMADRPGIIAGLARFVQENCAYQAIEFGRRAEIPHSPGTTLVKKYGDCKDHAVLLRQLLRSRNVPAHLALVHTDTEILEAVPSLDQFNHMVAYVPGDPDGLFLDPTDKSLAVHRDIPLALGGRLALILDPEDIRLQRIPGYPAGSSGLTATRTVVPSGDRDFLVTEIAVFEGYAAAFLRSAFAASDVESFRTWAEDLLQQYAQGSELQSWDVAQWEDLGKPIRVDMTYALRRYGQNHDDSLFARIPAFWDRHYLAVERSAKRATPFRIEYPFQLRSTLIVRGNDTLGVARIDGDPQSDKTACSGWKTRYGEKGKDVTLRLAAVLRPGTYRAAEYAGYYESMNRAIDALSPSVRFRKK